MEDAPYFIDISRLNDQMYGYVFHGIIGPNDGQTSKTQWFFSNETCADIHLLASCRKDNLRKFNWDLVG